jgi:hypothetical protein
MPHGTRLRELSTVRVRVGVFLVKVRRETRAMKAQKPTKLNEAFNIALTQTACTRAVLERGS